MNMIGKALLFCCVLLVLGALIIPALSQPSNCGGNSAALSRVGMIALLALNGASDSLDHSFRFAAASSEQAEYLAVLSDDIWVRDSHFLVTTGPVTEHDVEVRQIIVVCDTPYRNVPQRLIFTNPPTHAAAFTDGSAELISTDEFAALDRSTFVALDELYPPRKE